MRVFLMGHSGDLGGACTEAWHTVKVWRRFGADIHLIPTWGTDAKWGVRVDALGCTTHLMSPETLHDVPGMAGAVVVSFCNGNNPDTPFPRHDWAKVVNAALDLGLYTRFAAACLAQHECVLIQDDDLELPLESLRRLYDAWERAPDILHGVFGRAPKPDGSYARDVQGDADVPVVLTRVLLAHTRYAAEFFQHRTAFSDIQNDSRPAGNGEDIIFNYVAMWASGRLNRVHRISVVELPAPHAIHNRAGRRRPVHEPNRRWLAPCLTSFPGGLGGGG